MKVLRRSLAALAGLAAAGIAAAVLLAWHQGYRVYVLHTGSMIPALRPGYAVADRPATGPLRRGEIITFRLGSGQVVTHRLLSDTAGVIRTKGDANPTPDPWTIRRSEVIGSPVAIVPGAGYVLVYLRQPTGAASVVTVTVMVASLWGLCFPAESAESAEPGDPAGPDPRSPGDRHAGTGRGRLGGRLAGITSTTSEGPAQ